MSNDQDETPTPVTDEMSEILFRSSIDTPPFLRGVLVSDFDYRVMKSLIQQCQHFEHMNDRYAADVARQITQSRQFVGSMMTSLLDGADVKDATITALAESVKEQPC